MTEHSIAYNQREKISKLFDIICESDWFKKLKKLKNLFISTWRKFNRIAQKNKPDYVTKEIMKALELLKTLWGGLSKRQGHCGKVPLFQSALFLRLAQGSRRGVRRKILDLKGSNILGYFCMHSLFLNACSSLKCSKILFRSWLPSFEYEAQIWILSSYSSLKNVF